MLCLKNKDKKSESNSQQSSASIIDADSCVWRTKIKNLKAIHNKADDYVDNMVVVFEEQR